MNVGVFQYFLSYHHISLGKRNIVDNIVIISSVIVKFKKEKMDLTSSETVFQSFMLRKPIEVLNVPHVLLIYLFLRILDRKKREKQH